MSTDAMGHVQRSMRANSPCQLALHVEKKVKCNCWGDDYCCYLTTVEKESEEAS